MPSLAVRPALAVVLIALLSAAAPAAAVQVEIAGELERLRAQYGFTVNGEEILEDAKGRAEGENVYTRLRLLLERFDHIIIQTPDGGIERVLIMGRAKPGAGLPTTLVEIEEPAGPSGPQRIELPTIRDGNQHAVEVTLEGASGRRLQRQLLIDTGADAVVLPTSLISALGIAKERLAERQVQTANGMAQARMGRLPAVWLDGQEVVDVEVAFLDDDKLGDAGLLGMSVLGRYQMTIDDAQGRLTLRRK